MRDWGAKLAGATLRLAAVLHCIEYGPTGCFDAPTSTVAELLTVCDANGIRLLLSGDGGLTVGAGRDALTPELVDRVKSHKVEPLSLLRPTPDFDVDRSWPEYPWPMGLTSAGLGKQNYFEARIGESW